MNTLASLAYAYMTVLLVTIAVRKKLNKKIPSLLIDQFWTGNCCDNICAVCTTTSTRIEEIAIHFLEIIKQMIPIQIINDDNKDDTNGYT